MNASPSALHARSGPHWVSRAAFPVVSLSFFATQALLGIAVSCDNYWVAVPLALLSCHLMHGILIGFHEASHGILRKSRTLNNIDGIIIGIFSLMSFTLYRAAHQTHHSHLGTERDEELWPFVVPTMPRWARVLAAFCELFLGLVFTPFLFMRTFLRRGSPIRSKRVRRRIWMELLLAAVVWTVLVTAVAVFGWWKYFLWLYFIPAFVAANLQSWRKYIEHVGLTGSTIRSGTRSIVADDMMGKFLSFTLLHEPYHGVHHLRVGIPHAELPMHVDELQPETSDELPPFPSYRHAFAHLIGQLADPRVGSQWHRQSGQASGAALSA